MPCCLGIDEIAKNAALGALRHHDQLHRSGGRGVPVARRPRDALRAARPRHHRRRSSRAPSASSRCNGRRSLPLAAGSRRGIAELAALCEGWDGRRIRKLDARRPRPAPGGRARSCEALRGTISSSAARKKGGVEWVGRRGADVARDVPRRPEGADATTTITANGPADTRTRTRTSKTRTEEWPLARGLRLLLPYFLLSFFLLPKLDQRIVLHFLRHLAHVCHPPCPPWSPARRVSRIIFGSSSKTIARTLFSDAISGTWPGGVADARLAALELPGVRSMKTTPVMPLSFEARLRIGLDRRFLAQPDIDLHEARVGRVDRHGLHGADVDAVELDRIAERKPADRLGEVDPVDDVVALCRLREPARRTRAPHARSQEPMMNRPSMK